MPSIYLAGPEVFLADALDMGRRKKELCDAYGLEGLFPLDAEFVPGEEASSRSIFEANVAMIRRCDGVIANLTPFRGASADAGTVFEVGMAFALEKQVFAYTNVSAIYAARCVDTADAPGERLFAADGLSVEDFGLFDNLMIAEALRAQGHDVAAQEAAPEGRYTDLAAFELCLRQAAAFFA
ncbi:nucleoside 2-deoxyribosyltransferase [Methylocystis sp. IM3]|uniref:nucleoside 2-deoxyribosyltransferase n=1 Tax=unclassified Methylocystis TaxID=2625913 RepID=UPI0030FA8B67